jgi:hypothetical protein
MAKNLSSGFTADGEGPGPRQVDFEWRGNFSAAQQPRFGMGSDGVYRSGWANYEDTLLGARAGPAAQELEWRQDNFSRSTLLDRRVLGWRRADGSFAPAYGGAEGAPGYGTGSALGPVALARADAGARCGAGRVGPKKTPDP